MSRVLVSVFFLAILVTPSFAQDDWRAEADARIEKNRKTDVAIFVIRDDEPVADAEVRVKMVRHEFLFGCNIFMHGRAATPEQNAAYNERYAEILNFATLPYYWWDYERVEGKPGHESRERTAAWCAEHGIRTKGHPLAWSYGEAKWMTERGPEAVWERQLGRITDCVSHFQGKIDTWDVVNEMTQFDRGECAKQAPTVVEAIRQAGGAVQATKECFAAAREAAPDACLLVNDYMTDASYEKLLDELCDEGGKPIFDVVGIQSHMHGGTWDNARITEVCDRFSKYGLPIHFTELTILSGQTGWELGENWNSTPEGEAKQAAEVTRVYTMLFSQPAVQAITWWDFSDQGAWQRAPAGLLRADMSEKPAYSALRDLIKGAWWTDVTLQTDAAGKADARVFRGTYEVTVTLSDGTVKVFLMAFSGEGNEVIVEVK